MLPGCSCGSETHVVMCVSLICSCTGAGNTDREDLARCEWASCDEEMYFYWVSLQPAAQSLWITALGPRIWPHEQVRRPLRTL